MRLNPRGVEPMSRWPLPVRSSIVVAVASAALAGGLVLACTGHSQVGDSVPASPATSGPAATAPASDAVEATADTQAPTPAAGPPGATLAVDGGDPVIGQLGSFTWADGGSDSPWLPGSPVAVGAGEPLTVDLADGVAIATWSARRVPAGTSDGAGAVGLGSGQAPVMFAAPGPGSWSVQVDLTFAGGRGAAVYYWLVTVR
jgi:hypothetical protein